MNTLSTSFGSQSKSVDHCFGNGGMNKLCFISTRVGRVQCRSAKPSLTVHAGYRPNSGSIFVGGFVLGGLVFGTLGCVYAPQISNAIIGTEKKDVMGNLAVFAYDEENEVERRRRIMAEKIAELNIALDDASAQLRAGDSPNGVALNNSDEIEIADR